MGGTKLDKVCIYGVFEFTGFHLCKSFLEKGFTVDGIHFDTDDLFLEEKRLEVGRNANFSEKSLPFGEQNSVTIIPVYDWFMASKEGYKKLLPEVIQSLNDDQQIVYLLPIQLLTDLPEDEALEEVRNFIDQTKNIGKCIQYFYLPTIFGPWQPNSFLFQRELLNQINHVNEQIEVREWPFDAIYVEDVLEPIITRIESGEAGSFLIESGIPKSWELCAEILGLEQSFGKGFDDLKLKMDDGIKKITLNEVTPYQTALKAQKEHVSFIFRMMDFL
jgi:nucleoside-diphosphate-sugar epimerase